MSDLHHPELIEDAFDVERERRDGPLGTSEFMPGLRNLGTISADFIANTSNAQDLDALWKNKSIEDFTITYWTSGFTKSGTAFISEFNITGDLTGGGVVEGSITLTVKSEA